MSPSNNGIVQERAKYNNKKYDDGFDRVEFKERPTHFHTLPCGSKEIINYKTKDKERVTCKACLEVVNG